MKRTITFVLLLGLLGTLQAQTLTPRQLRKVERWKAKEIKYAMRTCYLQAEIKEEIKRVPNFEKEYVPMETLGLPNTYVIQEEWLAHLIQEFERNRRKTLEFRYKIEELTGTVQDPGISMEGQ
jgi:hypothetical protein